MQPSSSPTEKALLVARTVAANQWAWPLPALLVGAIALVSSSSIWQRTGSFSGRGASKPSVAAFYIATMAFCSLIYWALMIPAARDIITTTTSGRLTGLREPSDAERGCVVSLLRLMTLVIVYLFTGAIASQYLF